MTDSLGTSTLGASTLGALSSLNETLPERNSFVQLNARMAPQRLSNAFYHTEKRVLLRGALTGRGTELISALKPRHSCSVAEASREAARQSILRNEAKRNMTRQPTEIQQKFAAAQAKERQRHARGGVIARTFFESQGAFDDAIKGQAETYFEQNRPFGGRWKTGHVSASHPASGARYNLNIPEPVAYT